MDKEKIKSQIDKELEKLPSFSPAAVKIIELSNDLSASPKDLMNVIKIDPVLTGKILQLVNSTYFSLPQKITSLNRALILLGFNTIKNIALSTAFIEVTGGLKSNEHFNLDELWFHLLAVGSTSKLIAKVNGRSRQKLEEYFIAGLLHDIGDMMLMKYASEEYRKTLDFAQENNFSAFDASQSLMGITGPEVGLKVATFWKLPDTLKKVIARAPEGEDEESSFIIKTVFLADRFCRRQEIGHVCDKIDCDITDEDLNELEMDSSKLEEVTSSIEDEIEKAKVFINWNQ